MAASALEQIAVFQFVKDNWDESARGPMKYENVSNPAAQPGVLYTSIVMVPNTDARVRNSIGGPRLIRNYGYAFFTIQIPQEKGTLPAKRNSDFICDLFDDGRVLMSNGKTLVFGISDPQTLGQRDGTYRFTVSCPYYWDEA